MIRFRRMDSKVNRQRNALLIAATSTALFSAGCGVLNPAFVALIDPEGDNAISTIPNPPGHVVIQFVNNAEMDEQLVAYLKTAEGGSLDLTDAEQRALRPRFRLNLLVTYENASQTTLQIEFEGTDEPHLEPGCSISITKYPIDDNFVLICDVDRVELIPDGVEVLVPVSIDQYELQEFTTPQGGLGADFVLRDQIPCGWLTLQLDDDQAEEEPLLRNVDPRTLPGGIFPECGDVITYEITGQLKVPFLQGEEGPSYDIASDSVEAGIGGRYEIRADLRR